MLPAPIPDGDEERVAQLREFYCVFAPREERFDRITRLARKLLEVPLCCISIADDYEVWFLSEQGFAASRTRRDTSLCGHTLAARHLLTVTDTLLDDRFVDNPHVAAAPFMRAYAGVPLEIEPGLYAGTLCVMDTTPRQFSPEELQSLQDLAAMVVAEIRLNMNIDRRSLGDHFLRGLGHNLRAELIDAVTGCWNSIGLAELLRRLDNSPPGKPLTLVRLQVEVFARLNALFGQKADLVVSALAQQIRRTYSERAVFCRPFDNSFVVIFESDVALAQNLFACALRPHLQQERFEVMLPSFPRPFEILTQSAAVVFNPASGEAWCAAAAWQAVGEALAAQPPMPRKKVLA